MFRFTQNSSAEALQLAGKNPDEIAEAQRQLSRVAMRAGGFPKEGVDLDQHAAHDIYHANPKSLPLNIVGKIFDMEFLNDARFVYGPHNLSAYPREVASGVYELTPYIGRIAEADLDVDSVMENASWTDLGKAKQCTHFAHHVGEDNSEYMSFGALGEDGSYEPRVTVPRQLQQLAA